MTILPTIKAKNTFEEALDKLDLQGCLLLLTVLSEKALYLQSISKLEKNIITPNTNNTTVLTESKNA